MSLDYTGELAAQDHPSAEQLLQPAVGILTTAGESDAVAGAILRAQRAGLHPIVVVQDDRDGETEEFARQIGASVLQSNAMHNGSEPSEQLIASARSEGFPGVIVQTDPSERIDYEETIARLNEMQDYAVESVAVSSVEADVGVLVAIPAYNEAATIGKVVREAQGHADEVIVVDDGSADETVAEAQAAGAVVVAHERNRGYGAALKTAFWEAKRSGAEHLVILDGDDQHDSGDISRLVEKQKESGAEMVIGSRFDEGSETDLPLYRRFGLTIVNVLTNLSLGVVRPSARVRDTQCGFRAYDERAISTLAEDGSIGNDMDASTDILHHAHLNDYEIEEIGTTVDYDVGNASSQQPVEHGMTLVKNLVRTIEQERPLTVLGVPAFILTFTGILLAYWTFSNYIATGTFPIGLAVTSGFFGMFGMFIGVTATILHAFNQQFDRIVDVSERR